MRKDILDKFNEASSSLAVSKSRSGVEQGGLANHVGLLKPSQI